MGEEMANTDCEKFIINEIENINNTGKIDIIKAIILLDLKKLIESKIVCSNNKNMYLSNNFERIMHYFATTFPKGEISDLECREPAKAIYKKLRWDEEIYDNGKKYYDVINSFWTVYTCGAVIETAKIENKNVENASYFFGEKNEVRMLTKGGKSCFFGSEKYASKYLKLPGFRTGKGFYDVVSETKSAEGISELAGLCHCSSNFMPCPTKHEVGKESFNQLKGCLDDVKDFLPLMIDKIEDCISKEIELKYGDGDNDTISIDILCEWKNWFINNRKRYMLEDYYYVVENAEGNPKIIGIPMFKKQSLSYPIPRTKAELKECITEMNRRIYVRGLRMANELLLSSQNNNI